jgi:hypothetical protein
MNQDIDVHAELTNRLTAYFLSTLRAKMMYGLGNANMQIASIDTSGVKFSLLSIAYDNLMNLPLTPKSLVTKEFRNESNATIHSTFQQTEQSTDSFTWSLTQGLKLGASAKFQAGVPLIGNAEANLSTELSLGAGEQKTVTTSHTWTESEVFDIPAKQSIKASIVLDEARVNTPFTATVLALGEVVYHLNIPDLMNSFHASLEGGVQWPTRPDLNRLPVLVNADGRKFFAHGTFTGRVGISTHVATEQIAAVGV